MAGKRTTHLEVVCYILYVWKTFLMISLKNITLKNFLSIGQVTQAVDFDKKELTFQFTIDTKEECRYISEYFLSRNLTIQEDNKICKLKYQNN